MRRAITNSIICLATLLATNENSNSQNLFRNYDIDSSNGVAGANINYLPTDSTYLIIGHGGRINGGNTSLPTDPFLWFLRLNRNGDTIYSRLRNYDNAGFSVGKFKQAPIYGGDFLIPMLKNTNSGKSIFTLKFQKVNLQGDSIKDIPISIDTPYSYSGITDLSMAPTARSILVKTFYFFIHCLIHRQVTL